MKKILTKFLFAAILVLFRLSLPAQNTPAPTRMERDMKIFSTMLDEYMEKNIGKNNMFNNNTKIEYLDGFGVLVNVICGKSWETRGEIWINNKLEKLENGLERIDKIFVEPNMRVRTNSGNVKVRTTTKNGRTTIVTNNNGKITTQEFDEKDRNNQKKYSYHSDNNDYEQSKADKKQHKADMKQHKRDIEQHKRDMAQHKKDIERNQDDIERLQKDMQKEGREASKEDIREAKRAMKEAEREMEQARKEMEQADKEMQQAEKEMEKADKEMKQEMAIFQATEDSVNKIADAKTEEAIKDFLVQYADLITELKPNERIRIVYSDVYGTSFGYGENYGTIQIDGKINPKGLEVFKSDIDNFKSSKNEQNFKARIRQIVPVKAKESLKVDMLSAIFDKVLSDANARSENIKIQGKTQVTYLEDYSIKYDSRIYLKNKMYSFDNQFDKEENTQNKTEKEAKQDENIIKEQNLIEKNGKEYFVLYGKTASAELKANEKLIWEIDFGDKNKNPKILKKIIFYVNKSTLEDFDSRKITLEQAMAQVKTEKK